MSNPSENSSGKMKAGLPTATSGEEKTHGYKELKEIVVGAGIGGFTAGMYGGWDMTMWVLLGCMVMDYASGMLVAAMGMSAKSEGGGLNSNVGWKGLARKIMTLLLLLVAAMLDRVLGDGAAFRSMARVAFFSRPLNIPDSTKLYQKPP